MSLISNELSKAVRLALTLGAATGMVASTAVFAQDADEQELQTITVIGSRIKRVDVETSQPVLTLEREDIARTGLANIGDILQDITTQGSALNSTINNGNDGETNLDLRNLGANRTLVLVNGRRWVSGLNGVVDLNTIPASIVERVEILKDGASAIYGSDAVAGVVNIVTRDDFDGAEATAYIGENEEGDGQTQQYNFTIGSSGEKASVVMDAAYTKQDPIFAGDRELSRVPSFGVFPNNTGAGASGTIPQGRFPVPGLAGGNRFLPDGAQGCRANQNCPDAIRNNFAIFNGAINGFNFAPFNYLQIPLERSSIYAQGRYNFSDNVSFRSELLYNERKSQALLAPQPLVPLPTIAADNIYNPFNVAINGGRIRPLQDPRLFSEDVDTFRVGGGFEGSFEVFDRSFSWDLNGAYNENSQLTDKTGFYSTSRIAQALGPSFINPTGGPGGTPLAVCGTVAAPIADCVPFNVFGGQAGITREQLDAIQVRTKDIENVELYNYSANISGDVFELPAGPLAFAAGYEYRKEQGFNAFDALTTQGAVLGDNAAENTRGSQSVDEAYLELNIPILKDMPFANLLEVNVAGRISDYSTFGDTTNPKIGIKWKPIEDLLFRGNYAEGFRAPSVSELFLGIVTGFPEVEDPCSADNPLFTLASAACRARGVPAGYVQNNSQINTTFGGNPDLSPEQTTSKTLGLVYSPGFIEGFDIALDWYQIEIVNAIGTASATGILNDCFLSGNQNSCTLLTRDLSGSATGNRGEITTLFANNQNFTGGLEVEGFDLSMNYRFDTDFGRFRFNWDTAYTSYYGAVGQNDTINGLDENQVGESIGTTGVLPRIKSNVTIVWGLGDWEASVAGRYRSGIDEPCTNAFRAGRPDLCTDPNRFTLIDADGVPETRGTVSVLSPENHVGSVLYIDLQASYNTPWNGRITAGIRNANDRDPPVSYSAFANSFFPEYDVPGRFWYMSYTQRF